MCKYWPKAEWVEGIILPHSQLLHRIEYSDSEAVLIHNLCLGTVSMHDTTPASKMKSVLYKRIGGVLFLSQSAFQSAQEKQTRE